MYNDESQSPSVIINISPIQVDEKDWRDLYFSLADEVDQVPGKALGYPWYKDDQKNFPDATEEDGVCTGEHTPETLLAEAAAFIKKKHQSTQS